MEGMTGDGGGGGQFLHPLAFCPPPPLFSLLSSLSLSSATSGLLRIRSSI